MTNPLKTLLEPGPLNVRLFPPNSRYHGIETSVLEIADNTTIIYLRRRFVPSPERFFQIREHTVTQGERADNLAARYHNDPEQFWLLCDANAAMRPEELTKTVGQKLRITLLEGVPGGSSG